MDFAPMLKQVFDFVFYYLSKEFTFAGHTATIGSVLIWCVLATLIIGVIRGLAD